MSIWCKNEQTKIAVWSGIQSQLPVHILSTQYYENIWLVPKSEVGYRTFGIPGCQMVTTLSSELVYWWQKKTNIFALRKLPSGLKPQSLPAFLFRVLSLPLQWGAAFPLMAPPTRKKSVQAECRQSCIKASGLERLFSGSTFASPVGLFLPWMPSCWLSSQLSSPCVLL